MLPKILIVGFVIAAVVAGGVWAIFRLTGPAAEAATRFVTIAGSAGARAAYAEAAPGIRSAMTEAEFETRLNRLRLTQAKSASWSSRSLHGSTATMSGMARLTSGDVTPMTVHLVRLDGRWLVNDFVYGQVDPVDN